jgi:hypothetical protein
MVADPKALHYILHASGYSFPKRADMTKVAAMVMGEGSGVCPWYRTLFFPPCIFFRLRGLMMLIQDKGNERQRKIMAPTFFASQLKVFVSRRGVQGLVFTTSSSPF